MKILYIMIAAYAFASVFVSHSFFDLIVFTTLVLIPFFISFSDIYFIGFLLFRTSFDAVDKYHLPIPNLNTPVAGFLIVIYGIILFFNKRHIDIILKNRFLIQFNVFFILFLASAILSSVTAESLSSVPFSDFARLISILILVNYTVVFITNNPHRQEVLMNVLIGSSFIPVILGLYQTFMKKGMHMEGVNRIFGSFVHPNVFSEYLAVMLFPLIMLLSSGPAKPYQKNFLKIYLCVFCFLILHTFTRNVWIALLFTTGVYLTFGKSLMHNIRLLFLWFAGLLAISPLMYRRFLDLIDPVSGYESSWEWRITLWKKMLTSVYEKPFFGNGFGSFQERAAVMAHNDYLRLLFETGFIGLFFYLLLMGMILVTSFNKARNLHIDILERKKGLVVFCIFIMVLIVSMADNLARSTVILSYAFVVATLYLSEQKNYAKEKGFKNYARLIDQ